MSREKGSAKVKRSARRKGGGKPDKAGDGERRCLVSGEPRPKEKLIRFVLDGEGRVVPDLAAKLPGRGFWLSPSADMLNTAARKGLFSRAARAKAEVPDDLALQVERLLVRRAVDWLGLARRGGQAVSGLEKAKSWLIEGRAGLYVLARDAGPDSRKRLFGLVTDPDMAIERAPSLLDGEEMGAAFGRATAVHVALEPGGPAEKLMQDLARLAGFRTAAPAMETSFR